MRGALIGTGIAFAVAIAAGVAFFTTPKNRGFAPQTFTKADIEMGRALYAQGCAVCHGVNLEGQPDWQSTGADGKLPAPPHDVTGHTWHHKDSVLFDYIKLGGQKFLTDQGIDFDSGMPSFGDQLSDTEINNILAFIKSTWPDRERQAQADRTRAALELEGN